MVNVISASLALSEIDTRLTAKGLLIRENSGLEGFEAAHDQLTGERGVSPPLSSRYVDVDPADAFWIEARKDGALFAVQAMRRERITRSLAAHLDQSERRYYADPYEDVRIVGRAPAAKDISGDIVYHGDLFVDPKGRGHRIGTDLSQLAMVVAHLKWNPDFIWGYIAHAKVGTGYPHKIGYWHIQPAGVHFDATDEALSEGPGLKRCDWLVWMSREDMEYRCRQASRPPISPPERRNPAEPESAADYKPA